MSSPTSTQFTAGNVVGVSVPGRLFVPHRPSAPAWRPAVGSKVDRGDKFSSQPVSRKRHPPERFQKFPEVPVQESDPNTIPSLPRFPRETKYELLLHCIQISTDGISFLCLKEKATLAGIQRTGCLLATLGDARQQHKLKLNIRQHLLRRAEVSSFSSLPTHCCLPAET